MATKLTRTGRPNAYTGKCVVCKTGLAARAGELIDCIDETGKHLDWFVAHAKGVCHKPVAPVVSIATCNMWTLSQGCPLHGELCARGRN